MLSKPLPKDVFAKILRAGKERGVFELPEDPTIAVAWIVGMVQRSIIFLQRNITSLQQEKVIDETVRASLRMLKA